MKHPTVFCVTALAAAVTSLAVEAQKHPRTAWGDPDLTGAYSEFTTAPLERDAAYGNREFLTEAEYPEFAKRRDDLGALAGVASVGGTLAEEAEAVAAEGEADAEVEEAPEDETVPEPRVPAAASAAGPVSSKRERRRQRRASRPHGRAR